jgi:hypothetical protein
LNPQVSLSDVDDATEAATIHATIANHTPAHRNHTQNHGPCVPVMDPICKNVQSSSLITQPKQQINSLHTHTHLEGLAEIIVVILSSSLCRLLHNQLAAVQQPRQRFIIPHDTQLRLPTQLQLLLLLMGLSVFLRCRICTICCCCC